MNKNNKHFRMLIILVVFASALIFSAGSVFAAEATTTTVAPVTGHNLDTVDLSATLKDSSNNGIQGETITFSVEGNPVGSAVTDQYGVASLADTYQITGKTAGTYSDAISASFAGNTEYDPSSGTNDLTVQASAPVTLTDTAATTNLNAGSVTDFTVTAKNNGLDEGQNNVLTVTLPTGLAFWSASDKGTWDSVTRQITWNIGTIAAGETKTVTYQAMVLALGKGTYMNTNVEMTYDTYPSYAYTFIRTYTNKAPVTVTVTSDKENVNPGDLVTFTIRLTNNGPNNAINTFLKIMPISCGFKFVSSSIGTYDAATRTISHTVGTLYSKGEFVMTITLRALSTYSGRDATLTVSQKNNAEVLSQGSKTVHIN